MTAKQTIQEQLECLTDGIVASLGRGLNEE